MSGIPRDEKHGTRRNRLDVSERVEVHEFHVTAQRRVCRELRRASLGGELPSRRAVEVIELTLNGMGILIQLMIRPAGVFGFTASKLHVALLHRVADDLLSLFESQRAFEGIGWRRPYHTCSPSRWLSCAGQSWPH